MKHLPAVFLLPILLVACQDGTFIVSGDQACDEDRDCDDSIACTGDRCIPTVNGLMKCVNTPDDAVCPAGQICMVESLLGSGCRSTAALACAGRAREDECEPADACAIAKGRCLSGVCEYDRVQCADRPCMTSDGCDADSGICSYTISADGEACDADGDRCTADTCAGGRCVPGVDTCECSDSRPCVQPSNLCLGIPECIDGMCVSTPVDCSPFNTDCLMNYCVPSTGLCRSLAINEGGSCADALACTGPGNCDNGACVAGPLECQEKPCNSVSCIEPDGCRWKPVDGACDDQDQCNGSDSCVKGACVPTGARVVCDDLNPCTSDSCVPATGQCRFVPIDDCCGNSILENDEQCDGLNQPASGCDSCHFSVVSLDFKGVAPEFAWSDDLSAGLVTWEVVDSQGGRGVALRSLSDVGRFGETLPVPAGTVSGRSMSPVVAGTPDGFVLGALASDSPRFWLMDGSGRPKIAASVRNPFNHGEATGYLVLAYSRLRSVAAWAVTVPSGSRQLLFADVAVGPGQLLVSSSAVVTDSGPGGEIIPGDACAVDDGVVVTFSVRTENGLASVISQKAAYFRAGSFAPTVFDLAESEWDQAWPAKCARAVDGGFLAIYTRLERSPQTRIVVEGAFVDTVDGPGIPFEIESIVDDSGTHVMPFSSDLAVTPSGLFLYLCPLVSPSLSSPETMSPALIEISPTGKVLAGPVGIEGPSLEFAGGLAIGVVADSAVSAFWVETSQISSVYTGGQVAGRLYPADGW